MKVRLPNLLSGLRGKSQIIQDELIKLREQMVHSAEGWWMEKLAKEPSRLCVDEVHRVLVDIVSAAANATPGLGRYPFFKREVVATGTAALEGFKNEARNMVVALVDMERAFVPPQHFIRWVQRRMDRQRREEELRGRSSKKGNEVEQSISKRSTSLQTGGQQN
ncbi:dynamin-2A-like [Olea europaea subsp. europaea]|uniref:Dynamin-2A-like n=1 Tax=Olea europaea subsp. europaea TaxID=158383 RepID=A0A8S0S183_OLEEU|nr:dynamin-2A-like [Olea europaea subsp. europaea]